MNESQGNPGFPQGEPLSLSRALRDAAEIQSAAARFFGGLARQAERFAVRKLLFDFTRVEQLMSLQIDVLVARLEEKTLIETASPGVACTKTSPEWLNTKVMTVEQAISIALDCNRRAFHHHISMCAEFDGRAGDFFLELAQADEQRSCLLDDALSQRLRAFASAYSLEQVFVDILGSVRRAGGVYAKMGRQSERPRTREFLEGMVEVCALHAGAIQGLVTASSKGTDDPFFGGLDVILPVPHGSIPDLGFVQAMCMAMNAQRRGALVHAMLARAYSGDESRQLLEIADAERKYAATIAHVVERMQPDGSVTVTPVGRGPRESWTCPAIPVDT